MSLATAWWMDQAGCSIAKAHGGGFEMGRPRR